MANHGRTNNATDGELLAFTVPGKPQPKQRVRFIRKTGHAYTPDATVKFERRVAACALTVKPEKWPLESTYSVRITAVPQTHQPFDLDNLCKSILDGLNKILWKDDRLVTHLRADRQTIPEVTTSTLKADLVLVASEISELSSEELSKWNRGQLYELCRHHIFTNSCTHVWVRHHNTD